MNDIMTSIDASKTASGEYTSAGADDYNQNAKPGNFVEISTDVGAGCEDDEKAKSNEYKPEHDLAGFIMNLPFFFKHNSFFIKQTFSEEFFSLIPQLDADVIADVRNSSIKMIIRTMLCSNVSEYASFDSVYRDYLDFWIDDKVHISPDALQAWKSLIKQQGKLQEELDRTVYRLTKQSSEIKKLSEEMESEDFFTEKEMAAYQAAKGKAGKQLAGQVMDSTYSEIFRALDTNMREGNRAVSGWDIPGVQNWLRKLLTKCIQKTNYKDCAAFISVLNKMLEKADRAVRSPKNNILQKCIQDQKSMQMKQEQIQKQLEQLAKAIEDSGTVSVKDKVLAHRPDYISDAAHKSIQVTTEMPAFMDKPFSQISKAEIALIAKYIADNAQKFKTRILHNIRANQQHKIDMGSTIKKACSTNGIPLDLQMVKPKKQKANVVMILDVSGSCKTASNVMLTFMHEMQSVFPNGCRAYVFVNSLYDVTTIFRSAQSMPDAFSEIGRLVPTRGVYSDYGAMFRQFGAEHMHEINRDTIIIFIGDARNNRRADESDIVRNMCRKAKSAFWLNTGPKLKWGDGDSIIELYAPYMKKVYQAVNAGEIVEFLSKMR